MEKNWCRALAVVSLLLFVPLIIPAYAEDYVSTNVPPDDVVLRMINAEITGSEPASAQLLGKLQDKENQYTVFYLYSSEAYHRVVSAQLLHLDTHIWILVIGVNNRIVQK